MYRLQPLCKNGSLCFAAVFPLEQITLLPDIMRGSNSFQTADMPLKKSVTAAKDQTYALYNLTPGAAFTYLNASRKLSQRRDPRYGAKLGLPVASKPDSQEICFIPDHDYASFIEEYTGKTMEPGNFVDLDGNVLGRHKGISHYTVGQRKG